MLNSVVHVKPYIHCTVCMYLVIQCNCPYFPRLIQSVKNLIRRDCFTCLGLLFHSCSFGIVLLTDWRRWIWWSIWTTGTTTSFTAYKTTCYFYYSLTDFMVKCQKTLCITAAQVAAYIIQRRQQHHIEKMPKWLFWQVPEETGTLAFAAAAELAAAVAEALNTVCGTRRGMSGTSLLPSAAHSAQLPAP